MSWFQNLRTAAKLALGFGICLLLTVVVGTVALSRIGQMNHVTDTIANDDLPSTGQMAHLVNDIKQFRILESLHVLANDKADLDRLEGNMKETQAAVDKDTDEYGKSISEAEDKTNFETLKTHWAAYLSEHQKVLVLARSNQDEKARLEMEGASAQEFGALQDTMQKMLDWNIQRGQSGAKQAAATYNLTRSVVLSLLFAACLMGCGAAFMVARSLVGPLHQMASVAEHLAVGDVEQDLKLVRRDEIGRLADTFRSMIGYQKEMAGVAEAMASGDLSRSIQAKSDKDVLGNAFAKMITSLSHLVGKARVASDSIAAASSQVAAGSEDLSQRTTEQASSLEETASSMEEMTSTVKQNADNAKQANQLAAQARTVAENGGQVVSNAVASMQEINQASRRIADIISVIDEIAFQTNLLALNAAVEAARVGEQGRGFAVVAAEVRNLAGRSATAAKEIKALVQDSAGKVEEGSSLVNQSGEQLEEIVQAVKKVADIIAEITAASQEQAAGIEQVNKAVMQMDQITQQNAALVEEAAASSQSMTQQAQALQGLVSAFKLEANFLASLQQEAAAGQAALLQASKQALKATGTDGKASGWRGSSRPKLALSVNEDEDKKDAFEEF